MEEKKTYTWYIKPKGGATKKCRLAAISVSIQASYFMQNYTLVAATANPKSKKQQKEKSAVPGS